MRHLSLRPALLLTATLFVASGTLLAHSQERAPATQKEDAPKPPQVGETAPNFELKSIDGSKIKLSTQTKKGPVVLVELRGFPGYQCPICTAQVGQLMANAEKFAATKARVLLIYPGPAEGLKAHADEFVRGKTMPTNFFLLLDPDFAVTKKYGLRWDAPNETAYPSTFVLDSKRKVRFAKISHSHGDRAKIEEIFAALPS